LGLVELVRMMRMNPGGTTEPIGRLFYELDRPFRACYRAARDDHARNPHGYGTCDDFVAIVIVAVVREIDADIDERHTTAFDCFRTVQCTIRRRRIYPVDS